MTDQFSHWDSARYLETDDDIAVYLDACFEEGGNDARFITRALGTVARAKGMARVAQQAGLSPDRLETLLSPDSDPGFREVLRIIHALGLRLHTEKAA